MNTAFGDQLRLGAIVAGHEARALVASLSSNPLSRWTLSTPSPDRLIVAPQDLRTADPTIAAEIYSGRYSLAGRTADTGGQSPFRIAPPSLEWQRALQGFGWLRHLRAADTELSRIHARALIEDWLSDFSRWHPVAWNAEVTARRLIAWLSHSPLVLRGAEPRFYRRFMRALARQARYLHRHSSDPAQGAPRLVTAIALAFAGLCMSGQTRLQRHACRLLDEELDCQILPDGGHISRNPWILVELLLDLLPLRQTFLACDMPPSRALMSAIDRMMPMVRFFRHPDGAMAHFNGMGATRADVLATLFAYDDVRGLPSSHAPHSGYHRLEAGESVAIIDTGAPPPPLISGHAHAGCLSFEFSADGARLIVNCGAPRDGDPRWKIVARSTAAHSTATLDDTSSARFAASDWVRRRIGSIVLSGPRNVVAERHDGSGLALVASHDGYLCEFGMIHQRHLALSEEGDRLEGEDYFREEDKRVSTDPEFAIRFHLHPQVRASRTRDGARVVLVTPRGSAWEFHAQGADIAIEESIYLGTLEGPRRTEQIVLQGRCRLVQNVSWSLQRLAQPVRRGSRREPHDEELPLGDAEDGKPGDLGAQP